MGILNLFADKFRTLPTPQLAGKSSHAGPVIAFSGVGQPKWTPRRYENFAEEGFRKNVIAYRCVMQIAGAAASVPWLLYDDQNNEITHHPLLTLLRHPNPLQDGASFMEQVYAHLEIAGNAYVEAVIPEDSHTPVELYVLRPDRMRVIPGEDGLPMGYQYSVGNNTVRWETDPITGHSPILHLKKFHPLDDWYGLAPMEAAALSIDQHNAAGAWNQALLNQGARPSGALVFAPKDGPATLSDDQMARLRDELSQLYQGERNAGRPLILEGGLDWREMSLSPRDMDWLSGRNAAARDIALAFGVPAQLVGVPDSQTYANMAEARLAFYEETVLPLLNRVIGSFDHWLTPMFDEMLALDFDLDDISALASKRDAQWNKLEGTSFLTPNEKREAVGYEPIEGGDSIGGKASKGSTKKYNPDQPRVPAGGPEGGQWTADGGGGGGTIGGEGDAGPTDETNTPDNVDTALLFFDAIIGLLPIGRLRTVWRAFRSAYSVIDSLTEPKWTLGNFKSATRWANQLRSRDWTPEQITDIIRYGTPSKVLNRVNRGNTATQYIDPKTGRFVVRDDVTGEILQISGADFKPNQSID